MVSAILIAYPLIGIALVSYDFAAPPLYKKIYVLKRDLKMATLLWFIWPLSVFSEVRGQISLGKSPARFLVSIALLGASVLFWTWLLLTFWSWLLPWKSIAYLAAATVGLLTSPVLAFLFMPDHRER